MRAAGRRSIWVVVCVLVGGAGLLGCAERPSDQVSSVEGSLSTTTVSYPSPGDDQEYEAWALVIEGDLQGGKEDGPELCLGGIAESLPPSCGGPLITNWDWDGAPPSEQRSGVRWGEYHVRGTFNGETFTLTAAPERAEDEKRPDEARDRATTPCVPPAGGWKVVDKTKVTDDDALLAAAKAQPDFGGVWFDDLGADDENGYQDLSKGVFTVSFTGDLARHEIELRRVWGGPLCITQAPVTKKALDAAVDQLLADQQDGRVDGLDVLGLGVNEMRGSLDLQVIWAPDGTEAKLSEHYKVPIHLAPALRPI